MSDLIERLRTAEKNYVRPHDVESLYNEAADRIEELERRITVGKKIWFRRYQSHCFWRRRARKAEKRIEELEVNDE